MKKTPEMITTQDMDNIIIKLNERFKEDDAYYEMWGKGNFLCIRIEWGDWKHDHGYVDYCVEQVVDELGFMIQAQFDRDVEEDGTDCYSSTHYYYISKKSDKDMSEKFTKRKITLEEGNKLPYGVLAFKLGEVIRAMNNEEAYYDSGWLYIWGDDIETVKDASEYFNDKESFDDLKETFEEVYKEYHKDGLYTRDQRIVDYAHQIDKKLGLEPIENFGDIKQFKGEEDPYEESLKESPDDLGFESDEEIENDLKQKFEKELADRKAKRDANRQQELDRIAKEEEDKKAKEDAIKQGDELYKKAKKEKDVLEWFGFLVPDNGEADTVAGEVVRALNRINYRYFNDGDLFSSGYGRETCGAPIVYLYQFSDNYKIEDQGEKELIEKAVSLTPDYDKEYDKFLQELNGIFKDILLNHPEFFGMKNDYDSVDSEYFNIDRYDNFAEPRDYEYTIYLENDRNGEKLIKFLDARVIDIWELMDMIRDDIPEGAEFDRPWDHYATDMTITNLTYDEYNEVSKRFNDDYFYWVVEDLINEYGEVDED